MMQLNTFADKRMKILYALSFMARGIVQVWAKNETNVVLSHTSTFSTLVGLLAGIKRTFSNPDWERMAHAQLHALKMTTAAEEYMAIFEMLASTMWHWRMHSSEASLSQFSSRFTPKICYCLAWKTGRPLSVTWSDSTRNSLN